MKHELPATVRLLRIIPEARGVSSLFLPCSLPVEPGQFVMLWLPGVEAKPVAVSYLSAAEIGVTVSAVGEWSRRVCALTPGEHLGVFGPYGNSFRPIPGPAVLTAGGYGAASLMLLAERCAAEGRETEVLLGARSADSLVFIERLRRLGLQPTCSTDDGSLGRKGQVTDLLTESLQRRPAAVYICGPELMEKRAAEICRDFGAPCWISVERHMKCGFGVCGACCLDHSGKRVCVEGTVFSG